MPDFNIDVFSIPNLSNLLAKQKDFAEYISGMAFARSVLKVQLVEAGQDGQNPGGYSIINRQYGGVKDILEYLKQIFAGSTNLPATMLFNQSPDGLTSGKYELRSFAQYISNEQEVNVKPELIKLINYLHGLDATSLPKDYELEFPSILEIDESEEVDIQLKQAQRLAALATQGIITPEEGAQSLAEGIDIGQTIDLTGREQERQAMIAMPEGLARLPAITAATEEESVRNEP